MRAGSEGTGYLAKEVKKEKELRGFQRPVDQIVHQKSMEAKKMSKRTFSVVAALVILATVLSACQTPATTVAPQGTQPPAPTGGKWCSGVKIVFFPGGTPGGGFETVVYNGALAAAADTGADVQYLWSNWDPGKMTSQFSQAVATKPDGIAIMGHPGDTAFDPLIDDAEKQGIIVTSMNTQLEKAQAQYSSKGFGYAGAVLYQA